MSTQQITRSCCFGLFYRCRTEVVLAVDVMCGSFHSIVMEAKRTETLAEREERRQEKEREKSRRNRLKRKQHVALHFITFA